MTDSPRIEDAVDVVLAATTCSITLPAGAGKTQLIAATVSRLATEGGTSLVLTHTHAGVDVLRRRMERFGVSREQVVVRTIDSWAYNLIAHVPMLAKLEVPSVPDWNMSEEYHRAATHAVNAKAIRRMLKVTYSNVFIDEYQDCLTSQHELAVAIASVLPTVVLGDPLQCLFNFGKNQPVRWDSEVLPNFPPVEIEHRPRRWDPDHQTLGRWLVDIRVNLLNGLPIDLTNAPVAWVHKDDSHTFVRVCNECLRKGGSVAVLGRYRHDCVAAGSKLRGIYRVAEAIDEKVTVTLARQIDTEGGAQIASAVVEFAIKSTAGLAKHMSKAKRERLRDGKSFTTKTDELKPAYEAMIQLREAPTPELVRQALILLGRLPEVTIHCHEAWHEIMWASRIASTDDCTVSEALQRTRNHARVAGRRPTSRVVSRPLLAKGLEYEHAIILDPTAYSAQELYVALTRGSRSVTVISRESVLPAAQMATK